MKSAVIVHSKKAQICRQQLEAEGLWDKSRKLQKQELENVAIPVVTNNLELLRRCLRLNTDDAVNLITTDLPSSKSNRIVTPYQQLKSKVRELLEKENACHGNCDKDEIESLLNEVPAHWEKHGDLVLLPSSCFSSSVWQVFGLELWKTVARCVSASRVAKQAVIRADGYRRPQVQLLLGTDAVVQHLDNGIRYEYDLTLCMFSMGNITEKLRIASFNCEGETVVDLFAGIGYFTLPYLVHAKAKHVHACEWNPDAVQSLRKNLCLNHVADRCTIHPGDNRQLTLKGVADRVNLGLIPSSEDSWPVACRLLKPTGGVLHVHSNINIITAAGERMQPGQAKNHLENVSELHDCAQQHLQISKKCYSSAYPLTDCSEENAATNVDSRDSDEHIVSYTPKVAFLKYGERACIKLKALLEHEQGGFWIAVVKHNEIVKSYAPHVFHIVLDVECRPHCSS